MMKVFFENLKSELSLNNTMKSKFVVAVYRLSSIPYRKDCGVFRYFFGLFFIFNYLFLDIILNVELKPKTKIGWGLVIFHAANIVINSDVVVGKNLILRHGVTIGNKFSRNLAKETLSPKVGDNVEIGVGSVIVGDISVGDCAVIGASTYIDFEVPCGARVYPQRSFLKSDE